MVELFIRLTVRLTQVQVAIVILLYLHKSSLGDEELLPTSVQIFGYGESPVANLGAYTIAIYTGNSQEPQMVTFQVTDT